MQRARQFENPAAPEPVEVAGFEGAQGGQCLGRLVDERPHQSALGRFEWARGRHFPLGHHRLPRDRRLPDLGPHHVFDDSRLVRQPIGKLVAGRRIRDPGRDRQHLLKEVPAAFIVREIMPFCGAIEKVLEIRPRSA